MARPANRLAEHQAESDHRSPDHLSNCGRHRHVGRGNHSVARKSRQPHLVEERCPVPRTNRHPSRDRRDGQRPAAPGISAI
jgi:hypothetical protein